MTIRPLLTAALCLAIGAAGAGTASAQSDGKGERRVRIGLGVQAVPGFPGSEDHSVRPLVDVAMARGDEPFGFEAPDESFGPPLIRSGGLAIGPALNLQGSRKPKDLGAPLAKVDATIEAGAFVEYAFGPGFRLRTEARRGLGGHDGWIANAGADYVIRDGDRYLFSIGPRATFADGNYHRAYFGVTPAEAAASGLPAFDADGGLQALGATAGLIVQLTPKWGIYSYAKYDRLVGDAGRSPVVRELGSRNQLSGGLALTYTFGGGR